MTTFPLDLPAFLNASRVSLRLNRSVGETENPFTLKTWGFEWDGARWEAEVSLNPMEPEEAALWKAFFLKLRGKRGTFLMGDPLGALPTGNVSGTVLVDGALQAGLILNVKNLPVSVADVFKIGDYIQLSSGDTSRLHMIVENASSDGFGKTSLAIEPALRSSPADNDVVTYTNPRGVFSLASNSTGWDINYPWRHTFTFPCKESF